MSSTEFGTIERAMGYCGRRLEVSAAQGEYMGKVCQETKRLPRYMIEKVL